MTEMTVEKLSALHALLTRIADRPTVADLWMLRGTLLACTRGQSESQLLDDVAREFFLYLSEIQSKLTARQFNELASRLDVGAVGVLALQDILQQQENLWKNLVLGGLGEGLMVVASRQYVKAWEQELRLVHRHAAWTLYGVLWRLSDQHQPDLSSDERQALIESTLAPVLDDAAPFEAKSLLLLRLFQTLLLLLAVPLCTGE